MPPPEMQLEEHRSALTGHCYRMLGSSAEADDAVQETMVRAWRNLEKFEERAAMRTWLYRIATNVCLDAISDRKRRARPMDEPVGTVDGVLESRDRTHWLEPISEAHAIPDDVDPQERAMLRQSIRLAFVAALQHLPARQRAALLLTEVLGWSASEVASSLEMSVAAVNSALQRARATLGTVGVLEQKPMSTTQTELLDRYVRAFESYDVETLTVLLRDDATFCMPPFSLWLRGRESVRGWLLGRGLVCRDSRLVPIQASGAPAFAHYHPDPNGGYKAWAIVVLELSDDAIAEWNSFLDVETLFPRFGLPMRLE